MKICVEGAAWLDHFKGLHCGHGSVVDTSQTLILKQDDSVTHAADSFMQPIADDRVTHAADSFMQPIAVNTWLALNHTSLTKQH